MTEKTAVVYFAHGKESGPWGLKIKALADVARQHGCIVHSPDYSDTFDPQARIERLNRLLENESSDTIILVGSSMGGYVSAFAAADERIAGLFLMAPALYMVGYEGEPQIPAIPVSVVHGWQDDIVPPDNAIRFAAKHRATLLMLDAEHALNEVVGEVSQCFEQFLTVAIAKPQMQP